ncbi:MAG: PilZ domain-containing protein [Candidatus Eisenbacteria bacterium]
MAVMKKTSARRGRERRTSARADAKLSMRVEAGAGAGSPQIVTESQNISSSGIYCLSSHYLAPLSKVQLTIVLPRVPGSEGAAQELVKCESIVVRCDQRTGDRSETPYELACMFTGLEPERRRRVEEFVTWRNLQALRAALAPAPKAVRAAKPVSVRATARKGRTARAKVARGGAKKKSVVKASAKKRAGAKPVRKVKPARTAARAAAKPARKSASKARR